LLTIIGALSVIAGVLLIRHPLGGVTAVPLLLGIWFICYGIDMLAVGWAMHVIRHGGAAATADT
jgi:uncharacterized membrane protein HdeD (DUF308 family)